MGKSLNVSLLAIIMSVTFSATARCADWKYYGGTKTIASGKFYVFYDLDSIMKHDNNVKVWTKSVTENSLSIFFEDTAQSNSIYDKVEAKISRGYVTPFNKMNKYFDAKKDGNIAFIEEAVNVFHTNFYRVLYEIDCIGNEMKQLSVISTFKNGDPIPVSESELGGWTYIVPESTVETLRKMLCPVK